MCICGVRRGSEMEQNTTFRPSAAECSSVKVLAISLQLSVADGESWNADSLPPYQVHRAARPLLRAPWRATDGSSRAGRSAERIAAEACAATDDSRHHGRRPHDAPLHIRRRLDGGARDGHGGTR